MPLQKHPEETLIIVTADHETGAGTKRTGRRSVKIHTLLSRQKRSYSMAEGRAASMKTATEELFFGLNQMEGDPLSLSKEELRSYRMLGI